MMSFALDSHDKRFSRLILGTSTICPDQLNVWDSIYNLGCNTFDTARSYCNGDSERCLGQWIRTRGCRAEVTIITKGGHPTANSSRRINKKDVIADIDASLLALGTNELDIFLLHRDDPSVSAGEIIEQLNEISSLGKVRAFGASNWKAQRIIEAQKYATEHGLRPFCVSSLQFSLAEWTREPWPGCLTLTGPSMVSERLWYRDHALPILAWSSLAGGFFSTPQSGKRMSEFLFPFKRAGMHVYLSASNVERLRRATHLARVKQAVVPQIALAYVLCQDMNIYAIVSCSRSDHFETNLSALSIELSERERRWLNLESEELV